MPLNKTPGAAAVATPPAAVPAAAPAVAAEPKKRSLKAKAAPTAAVDAVAQAGQQAAAKDVAGLQPRDMEPKEKRIQRSGIWQAVVQSNALVQYAPTLDAFLDLVDKAADRGLQYVNRQ